MSGFSKLSCELRRSIIQFQLFLSIASFSPMSLAANSFSAHCLYVLCGLLVGQRPGTSTSTVLLSPLPSLFFMWPNHLHILTHHCIQLLQVTSSCQLLIGHPYLFKCSLLCRSKFSNHIKSTHLPTFFIKACILVAYSNTDLIYSMCGKFCRQYNDILLRVK